MASGEGIMTGDRKIRFGEFREKNLKIIRYLALGTYVNGSTESQKRVLRCQAKNHMYDDDSGALYYKGNKSDVARKVVMEENDALDILKDHHATGIAGHCGMNATLAKISKSYVWHGMKQDVVNFIKSCNQCHRCDRVKTPAPKLKKFTATEPQEFVIMDLMGPLPATQEDYMYVLLFVDFYTKFVDFFPLKSKDASSVASSIKTFLYRWGVPQRLVTPKGNNLVKRINAELCKKFGTACSVLSYRHPQTNGLIERTKQTLNIRLNKLTCDNHSDWAAYLDRVAYSIRTQKQATTHYTPFFLMFGRQPRSVLEMECPDDKVSLPVSGEASVEDIRRAVSRREKLMAETRIQVEQNVNNARNKHRAQRRQTKRVKPFNLEDARVHRNKKSAGQKVKKIGAIEQLAMVALE